VVVTGGAVGGEAEKDGGGGVGAVAGVAGFGFGLDGAAFGRGQVEAIVAGGDELIDARLREEIAGELLDGELVEGQVGVERADDPVAVGPDGANIVEVEAVGVGVADGVEPVAAEVFAVTRGGEKAGDGAVERGFATR
jgi:hypothetical protein